MPAIHTRQPFVTHCKALRRLFIPNWFTTKRRQDAKWTSKNLVCAQRNLFESLLNQTEIRLYLPFSDWFGIKQTSVWFQINPKMENTIWFRFDWIRFRKDFSVCRIMHQHYGHCIFASAKMCNDHELLYGTRVCWGAKSKNP